MNAAGGDRETYKVLIGVEPLIGRFLAGQAGSEIARGMHRGNPLTACTLGLSGSTVHSGLPRCWIPNLPTGSLRTQSTLSAPSVKWPDGISIAVMNPDTI